MILQSFSLAGVTYRQQYVKCGRSCSKCPHHGPYWYAAWASGDRTVTKYIGKQLPVGIAPPALCEPPAIEEPRMAPRTAARLLGISLSHPYARAHARKAKVLGDIIEMTDAARLQRHEIERAWRSLMEYHGW